MGEHPKDEEAELATGPRSIALTLPFHGDGPTSKSGRTEGQGKEEATGRLAKGPTAKSKRTEGQGKEETTGKSAKPTEEGKVLGEEEQGPGTEDRTAETSKVPGKEGKETEKEVGAMGNGTTPERATKPEEGQRPKEGSATEGAKEEGKEHTEEEDDEPTKEAPKEMGRGTKSKATGAERATGAFRPRPKRLEVGKIFRRRLSSFVREVNDEGGGEAKGTRRDEVREGGRMSMHSMAPRADGHTTTSS